MDSIMIAAYAGKHLENHSTVTVADVQAAIFQDVNVEKVVSVEDITFAMNILVDASFLEQIGNQGCGKFRRFIPTALAESLKHHGKRLGYDHNAPSLS
jgi:hypothetical protein